MTIQLTTLNNGVRVITEDMPGLGSTALGVWIASGSRDETAEENGIAHFLEHMAFKGTNQRSALKIAEQIEDVGGHLNAYTSREATAYYARVLADDAPLALDIIGDILTDSLFEPAEVELERNVILQEIGQSLDTPDDVIFDWLQETAFPDQAMGRPILGPAANVSRFQADDLRKFVSRCYAPERMIVSAAGAVSHDQIVAEAEKRLGALKSASAPARSACKYIGGDRREVKDLEQAHVALAFESPSFTDPEFYPTQLMSVALGGGMSSRLFQEVREQRGLCYTIFAQAGAYTDGGVSTIYAGTGADQVSELAQVTVDVIHSVANNLSQAELDRARAQIKAGLVMGLESPSARAERLARSLMIWGKPPQIAETVKKIDAVDLRSARSAASRMVNGAPSIAYYGPEIGASGLDSFAAKLAA